MGYDLSILGFIAEDHKRFSIKKAPEISLGGGILYGGLAAATFDSEKQICMVSKVNEMFDINSYHILSKQTFKDNLILHRCQFTTQYELDYTLEDRKLRLIQSATPFQFSEIPKLFWDTRVLLLTPIAREFTPSFLNHLCSHLKSTVLVGFDLQGVLREFDENGIISLNCNPEIQSPIIDLCRTVKERMFLKMDFYEALAFSQTSSLEETFSFLQNLPVHSFVTLGLQGLYYINPTGQIQFFEPILPSTIQDETGAGDTFLSIFLMELLTLQDEMNESNISQKMIFQAIKVGATAASFLVEKSGPEGFVSRTTIKKTF